MRRRLIIVLLAGLAALAAIRAISSTPAQGAQLHPDGSALNVESFKTQHRHGFEAQTGSKEDHGRYLYRSHTCVALFKDNEVIVYAAGTQANSQQSVRLTWLEGKSSRAQGKDILPARLHYFLGNDPAKWKTDEPLYRAVEYPEIYEHTDLVFYESDSGLEYDLVVRPGGNPASIRLKFDGPNGAVLSKEGINFPGTAMTHRNPIAYQQTEKGIRPIDAKYRQVNTNLVSFQVRDYDRNTTLVIDPVLQFSTFLGGRGPDSGQRIAVDAHGNMIVAGTTTLDFPTKGGTVMSHGWQDIFVSKFSPGGQLLFTTLIGGKRQDYALDMVLDSSGSIYVSGATQSVDFPVTRNAIDKTCGTNGKCNQFRGETIPDAFLLKLRFDGRVLLYSTYFGGAGVDGGVAVAVDSQKNMYLAGYGEVPVKNALFTGSGGGYVAKFSPSGTTLQYCTYLQNAEAPGSLRATSLATDPTGNLYMAGGTTAVDMALVNPIQTVYGGIQDAFVMKLNPQGNAILFSTYLGGGQNDYASSLAVDSAGTVAVTGLTSSSDFPVLNALQAHIHVQPDIFVTKMNTNGTGLVFSTYWGGSKGEQPGAVAMDIVGNVYVAFSTLSPNIQLKNSLQKFNQGKNRIFYDGFVFKLNPFGNELLYSTYFGGRSEDVIHHVAAGPGGSTYFCGYTASPDLILKKPFQPSIAGSFDAFIAKIAPSPAK